MNTNNTLLPFENKAEFITTIIPTITRGKFIIPKHDPNCCHGIQSDGKSVFSINMSGSISTFLFSSCYETLCYENLKFPNSPYIVVVPFESLVTGYDIPKGIIFNKYCDDYYEKNDCLVLVSGSQKGWHGHTEKITNIENSEQRGDIILKTVLL